MSHADGAQNVNYVMWDERSLAIEATGVCSRRMLNLQTRSGYKIAIVPEYVKDYQVTIINDVPVIDLTAERPVNKDDIVDIDVDFIPQHAGDIDHATRENSDRASARNRRAAEPVKGE